MSNMTEQILFSGRVQGVGFRWTTEKIATELQLAGFVRNLHDGRVEAIVAGSIERIQELIERLRNKFGTGINEIHRHVFEGADEFTGFSIRR
ncbi:MAG TPA: acylphosphatase [Planctomycetaceae bacterium]|nr:acylphosphatase [Planctomycetaceae bacterium]HQZ64045.1 acylphosphatase [Planctomycetaceae bacterium]HRA87804.1 acylphosphatase [Planctomycetaceae bacterium]